MKDKKKKDDFEDDGRVIAPMNVDGMPWYDGRRYKSNSEKSDSADSDDFSYKDLSPEEKKEYRKQTRRIIWGILKYITPFILAFVAVFGLFIYLLTVVWK